MQNEFDLKPIKIELVPLTSRESAVHQQALERAKSYLRSEADLLEAIDQVDRLRLFEKLGYTSMSAYCRDQLKLSDVIGGYFISVARKSREVPELKAAVKRGSISVPKAVRICAVVTPTNQAEWIEKAEKLPKAALEKAVAEAAPKKEKPPRVKPVGANRNRIETEASDEVVKLLRRAQDLESRRIGKSASLEETLKAVLEDYLDQRDPVRKAERARKKETSPQPPSPRLGRHPIPAAVMHQVNLRDRGRCRALGPSSQECGATGWTQTHHIIAVQNGGTNQVGNLITVCSAHHRLLHAEVHLTH